MASGDASLIDLNGILTPVFPPPSSEPQDSSGAAVPIAGTVGTSLDGDIVVVENNSYYTTAQVRNITLSENPPIGGHNGDIWIRYIL